MCTEEDSESILLCPDTHIGSVQKRTRTLWIYDNGRMIERPVTYVPGLYKIFDEILDTAAGNKPKIDSMKVDIDVESNSISVYSTGAGIPVVIHPTEVGYAPEFTSGAKLAGIFSSEFAVEIADGKRQCKQVFSDNMRKKSKPIVSKCGEDENWTRITFKPDLARFNMTSLNEDDVVALMKKRVIDIAGCLGKTVKVELNGETTFQFESFSSYCQLYMNSAAGSRFEEYVDDKWHICITRSKHFQQVSFVNSIATIEGGTHVDYVTDEIASHLVSVIKKKYRGIHVKPRDVKNQLCVFVKAFIDDPAFNSPTKEKLKLGARSFWRTDFTPEFLDKESDLMKNIEKWAFEDNIATKICKSYSGWGEKDGRWTLVLAQGGGEYQLLGYFTPRYEYAVFPLKGKLLNVREASEDQIMQNELAEIMHIIGLRIGVKYDDEESLNSLKCRHVMIITDPNHIGSYVKGLLINFFHTFWPALLKASFLQEFIIPHVKAKHRDGKRIESFYTIPQYVAWKESLGTEAKNWTFREYMGWPSFTNEEMEEYFQNREKHKREFVWENDEDGEAIELAFDKKKIEARKIWLQKFVRGTFLDPTEKKIRYRDFVNKELVYYFIKDHVRSHPSIVDGLTSLQREILLSFFKWKPAGEIQVRDWCGYGLKFPPFYHEELKRFENTIVGMAHDFVGSNNINLLLQETYFGSQGKGGKDRVELRYLSAQLSPMIRFLFPKEEDDLFLTYLNEDGPKNEVREGLSNELGQSNEAGQSVICKWYVPIIPMVLVNGSEGTDAAWSSYVPKYNPLDIIANLKRLLKGGEQTMVVMHPWYKGFIGSIEKNTTEDGYTTSGIIEEVDEETFEITELPIQMWTGDYTKFLESVSADNDKSFGDPLVKKFCDKSCTEIVHFFVRMSKEGLSAVKKEGLLKTLNLTTCVGTSNMHLFDSAGVIKKYETPEQILQEFFHLRLKIYEERKEFVLAYRKKEILKYENKCRYIKCVVDGSIILRDRERADLLDELKTKGFDPFPGKESVENSSDYDYLLSLEIGTFALEKMQAEKVKLEKVVEDLKQATVQSLWMRDLDALERQLTEEFDNNQKKWEALREKHHHDIYGKENEEKEDGAYVNGEAAAKPPLAGTKGRGPVCKQRRANKVKKLMASHFSTKTIYVPHDSESDNTDDSDDIDSEEEEEYDSSDE